MVKGAPPQPRGETSTNNSPTVLHRQKSWMVQNTSRGKGWSLGVRSITLWTRPWIQTGLGQVWVMRLQLQRGFRARVPSFHGDPGDPDSAGWLPLPCRRAPAGVGTPLHVSILLIRCETLGKALLLHSRLPPPSSGSFVYSRPVHSGCVRFQCRVPHIWTKRLLYGCLPSSSSYPCTPQGGRVCLIRCLFPGL